jgi:hypothetical protein
MSLVALPSVHHLEIQKVTGGKIKGNVLRTLWGVLPTVSGYTPVKTNSTKGELRCLQIIYYGPHTIMPFF